MFWPLFTQTCRQSPSALLTRLAEAISILRKQSRRRHGRCAAIHDRHRHAPDGLSSPEYAVFRTGNVFAGRLAAKYRLSKQHAGMSRVGIDSDAVFVYKNKTGAESRAAAQNRRGTRQSEARRPTGGNWTTLLSPLNQPDGDDGVIVYDQNRNLTLNPAGAPSEQHRRSQFAEVSYFLSMAPDPPRPPPPPAVQRDGGNAYRTTRISAPMIPGLYPPIPRQRGVGISGPDFDYSARIQPLTPAGAPTGVSFLGGSPGSASRSITREMPAIPIRWERPWEVRRRRRFPLGDRTAGSDMIRPISMTGDDRCEKRPSASSTATRHRPSTEDFRSSSDATPTKRRPIPHSCFPVISDDRRIRRWDPGFFR